MLSASVNKLGKLKEQAAAYASLIMEELDPDQLGYIEVSITSFSFYTFTSLSELLLPSMSRYGSWKFYLREWEVLTIAIRRERRQNP